MSHSIICDVRKTWQKETTIKRKKVTIVEALCFGDHKHLIEGEVIQTSKGMDGAVNIFIMVNGGLTMKVRKIEDHQKLKAPVGGIFRCCVVPVVEKNEKGGLDIKFITHKIQDPEKFFNMDGEPFKISLDDFTNDKWENGVQTIAISKCQPFISERSGVEGFNYTVAN